MLVRPSSRSRNTPLPGSKWSGVQVQYTMQSRSEGWSEARASAFRVAARARLAPVSPSETQCRVRIPERCLIHSSEVSIIRDSSSLVTTRSGTWNPVAINSVCGIAVPCGRRPMGQDFAPGPPKQGSRGSRRHPRAVRRRAGRAAPPRRSQAGAGRRQPRGRWGGRGLRTPPHVRGGHRTERAVRLERPHRPERGGDAGVARVRRPGEAHPRASGLLRRGDGLSDGRTVGPRGDMTRQMVVLLGCLTFPLSPFPFPGLSAQKRAITFDDFIALKSVSDPQLSPDGKWVAYTVTEYSLKDNRGVKRQHLFSVTVADNAGAKDITPIDHAAPTIATGGDGDVAVSPDGKEIAFAMHGDSTVADNTNVDIYLASPDGSGVRPLTTSRGADNTPRYSADGRWFAYLSMERPGFEADRVRLMLVGRKDGKTEAGTVVEATRGWTLSVGSYRWCPDSKCIYAVVEERGRDNLYRIDVPSFRRSVVIGNSGLNTNPSSTPDGKAMVYLHQSNTQPAEVWASGRQLTHHNDAAVAALDLKPLEEYAFVGALGDSVFGWILKPPGFDSARKYPLVYLVHGGPQGAWTDYWGARWNYAMFAARGYVVAAVNFHGSTGYGQKFTDAISQHWGDYPFEDVMKGLDVVAG